MTAHWPYSNGAANSVVGLELAEKKKVPNTDTDL